MYIRWHVLKASSIEDAFFFVSSAPYGTNSVFLNTETGQILYRSEMGDIDEITGADMDWDQMIEIPHKNDLDLGQCHRINRSLCRPC